MNLGTNLVNLYLDKLLGNVSNKKSFTHLLSRTNEEDHREVPGSWRKPLHEAWEVLEHAEAMALQVDGSPCHTVNLHHHKVTRYRALLHWTEVLEDWRNFRAVHVVGSRPHEDFPLPGVSPLMVALPAALVSS